MSASSLRIVERYRSHYLTFATPVVEVAVAVAAVVDEALVVLLLLAGVTVVVVLATLRPNQETTIIKPVSTAISTTGRLKGPQTLV